MIAGSLSSCTAGSRDAATRTVFATDNSIYQVVSVADRWQSQSAEISISPWKEPVMSVNTIKQSAGTGKLTLKAEVGALLTELGVEPVRYTGGTLAAKSPINGETVAHVREINQADATSAIQKAHAAFLEWRLIPGPKRGELVRLLGEELRANKRALGRLVSIEVGKIESEGLGEVQEMIDICDFAVGLSRQLYGLTIATERNEHRMAETWHPLGVTGIISAFNFPVAVWSWNAALALVCGNSIVWKPSEKTPLTALATEALFGRALARFKVDGASAPDGLSAVFIGGREIGEVLVNDTKVPLVSATGSTSMGRAVGPKLAQRFARAILELGGNNAAVITPTADLDLTLRGVAFAAMGWLGRQLDGGHCGAGVLSTKPCFKGGPGCGPVIGQRRPAINVVRCKPRPGAKFELIHRRCAVSFGSSPAAIAKADRAARADLGSFGARKTAGHRRKPQTNERSNRGPAYLPNRCSGSLSHC
jgi:hypothetical protein